MKNDETDYGPREPIVLEVKIDNDKYNAILFTDGDNDLWIPRALLHPEHEHIKEIDEKNVEVMVPEWFAVQEGMV